ncbi:MAG TPA: AprI/Inh family metalloprotease inhibitor [Sphingobium sp.]|nr:AprI/Inh family metalloprotease inhibitor [Sphingobium sp.]
MKCLLVSALLLAGCAEMPDWQGNATNEALTAADPAGEVSGQNAVMNAATAPVGAVPRDDGLGAPPEAYVTTINGKFQLWQNDRGEDGWMCEIELLGSRTIGGYGIRGDDPCLRKLGFEDLSAWFVEPDGYLVLIDATRKPVMRLKRADEGYFYFGNSEFYLSRSAEGEGEN